MSWDLFLDAHLRRLREAEGLRLLTEFATAHNWRIDWDLRRLLLAEEKVALVTDTAQVIQFATPNMPDMNGYEVEDVLGKTPRIFQGPATEPEMRRQLGEALVYRLPFKGSLLNYRKDGSTYHCLVEEYPVWNRAGALVHFIAFEKIA